MHVYGGGLTCIRMSWSTSNAASLPLTSSATTCVSTPTTTREWCLQALVSDGWRCSSYGAKQLIGVCFKALTDDFSSSSRVTDLSGLSLTGTVPGSSLIVKDECDFDSPQSLPSIDSGHSMQTIQHPPSSSRPPPTEAFAPPNLLPPAEASTSASSSAFPALAPGSGSKISHHCKQQHCVFAVDLVFNLLKVLLYFEHWKSCNNPSFYSLLIFSCQLRLVEEQQLHPKHNPPYQWSSAAPHPYGTSSTLLWVHTAAAADPQMKSCMLHWTLLFVPGPVHNELAFQPPISNHPGENISSKVIWIL